MYTGEGFVGIVMPEIWKESFIGNDVLCINGDGFVGNAWPSARDRVQNALYMIKIVGSVVSCTREKVLQDMLYRVNIRRIDRPYCSVYT